LELIGWGCWGHLRRSLRYLNAIDIDPAAVIEADLDPEA